MDHWPPSPEISTKPNLHTPKQRLNSIKIPRNSKPQILHWNKTFPGSATGSSTSPQPSTHPQKCKTTPRTFVVERPTKPQILIQRTHNHHHQYSQPRLPALPHFQPPSFSAALRTQNDFNPDQNAPKRTQKNYNLSRKDIEIPKAVRVFSNWIRPDWVLALKTREPKPFSFLYSSSRNARSYQTQWPKKQVKCQKIPICRKNAFRWAVFGCAGDAFSKKIGEFSPSRSAIGE